MPQSCQCHFLEGSDEALQRRQIHFPKAQDEVPQQEGGERTWRLSEALRGANHGFLLRGNFPYGTTPITPSLHHQFPADYSSFRLPPRCLAGSSWASPVGPGHAILVISNPLWCVVIGVYWCVPTLFVPRISGGPPTLSRPPGSSSLHAFFCATPRACTLASTWHTHTPFAQPTALPPFRHSRLTTPPANAAKHRL